MRAFVTVGSTRFDALVQRTLSDAIVNVLQGLDYSHIIVQCGNSEFDSSHYDQRGDSWVREVEGGGTVEVWKFKPSLQAEYEQADLVISHAGIVVFKTIMRSWLRDHGVGSGTILDVLRLRKPLIVVPNSTLLDDHQQELATALASLGHVKAATVS
jgi:beta-1,4-N-acetylglucosaminyltransferase